MNATELTRRDRRIRNMLTAAGLGWPKIAYGILDYVAEGRSGDTLCFRVQIVGVPMPRLPKGASDVFADTLEEAFDRLEQAVVTYLRDTAENGPSRIRSALEAASRDREGGGQ